ncbi:MAG: hypothetical protein AB7P02_06520 [Alphaproteobacteria bacterium]
MGFIDDVASGIGSVFEDLSWRDAVDIAKVAVPIIGSVAGAAVQSNANSAAAGQILQANQDQATQLQLGEDERLAARLSGIDSARGYLGDRTELAQKIIAAASTQYGGDVRAAASAFARAMPQLASTISQMYLSGALTGGDMMRAGAATAGGQMIGAAGDYGSTVIPAAGEFGSSVVSAAGDYGGAMTSAADAYREMVMTAPDLVRQALGPYADAGLQMLPQLMAIAQSDPSRLTMSQQRALDELRRGMEARLSASGLRGAGRAGVAAANEGEAAFLAKAFDSNRARNDQAMLQLNSQGFNANQIIGASGERAIYSSADKGFQAAASSAQAMLGARTEAARTLFSATDAAAKIAYQAASDAARLGYDAEKAAAQAYISAVNSGAAYSGQALSAAQRLLYDSSLDVAKNDQQAAYKIGDQQTSYYDQMAKYGLTEADLVGEAMYGKRKAEAAAVGPAAVLPDVQSDVNNASLWGSTIGQVSRMIADDRTQSVRPSPYWSSADTIPAGSTNYGSQSYYGSDYLTDSAGRVVGGI